MSATLVPSPVIPAKAAISRRCYGARFTEIPAYAGMTKNSPE